MIRRNNVRGSGAGARPLPCVQFEDGSPRPVMKVMLAALPETILLLFGERVAVADVQVVAVREGTDGSFLGDVRDAGGRRGIRISTPPSGLATSITGLPAASGEGRPDRPVDRTRER